VSAVREVNSLNEALFGKQIEKAENGGATDAEAALLGVCEQIGGGEVSRAAGDQGGEFTTRPGKANPRLVKRLEQLPCHTAILSELRLSLITCWGAEGA
jgi:hypothetical protein